MTFWTRVRRFFGADERPRPTTSQALAVEGGTSKPSSPDPVEEPLVRLAAPDALVDPAVIDRAVDALRRVGLELRAVELLGDAVRARPAEEEIVAALAYLHAARLDLEAAAPLLEALRGSAHHALRAELLLGERAERKGRLDEALRHYERVLARDVAHGQARARAERLRHLLGAREAPLAQATMIEPEGVSAQGRYRLVRELGRGGSGAIYLAFDTHMGREVALKVYHPQVMKADGASQLAREASLPARIGHPAIIRVLDVDAGIGAVVMELVSGGTLKDVLRRGSLDVDQALEAVGALCAPLAALHDVGIVHRDIKPGNILLRWGMLHAPVLTDLGIALLPGERHEPGVGTPAYMSPEQRTSQEIDSRSDVYAVGVILAAMLGGHPGQSGPVAELLDRCLCEEAAGRPRDARELGDRIESVRAGLRHADVHVSDVVAIHGGEGPRGLLGTP